MNTAFTRALPTCAALLLLAGCVHARPDAAGGRHDGPIPFDKFAHYFPPQQFAALRLNYDGYVILEGELETTNKVSVRQVLQSHPDHQRDQLARSLVRRVELTSRSFSTGSRIRPKVRICVMFHGRGAEFNEPKFAVIYAEQLASVGVDGEGEDLAIVYLQ